MYYFMSSPASNFGYNGLLNLPIFFLKSFIKNPSDTVNEVSDAYQEIFSIFTETYKHYMGLK